MSIFNLVPEPPRRSLSDIYDIVMIAPILEELFFRLPLRNFFKNIFFTLSILFYVLTKSCLGMPFSLTIALGIVAIPYIPGFMSWLEVRVNNTIERLFPFFFYLVALSFGFLHITNLEHLTTTQLFFSPVIVFYQILLGLYLGFLRVKFEWGIVYSIFVHSMFNAIPILIKIL